MLRCGVGLLLLAPGAALAQAGGDITLLSMNNVAGGQELSVKLQILIVMTLLGFLPAMLMLTTSFTRFIIVLSILRQAIGLQQTPPNNVLIGIALCLTMLIMRPVWQEMYQDAYVPFQAGTITLERGLDKGREVLSRYMLAQTDETALQTIVSLANEQVPAQLSELDFSLLLPAYVLSELKTAFQLGFMIFVPFLVIDLVVASVLMAMGMMMLSPMMVSLPFKLMIFVLVDGWSLLMGTLSTSVQSY